MSLVKNFFTGRVTFRVANLPIACLNKLKQYQIQNIHLQDNYIIFAAPLVFAKQIKKLVSNFEWQMTENPNFFRGINYLLNHCFLVALIFVFLIAYLVVDMGIYNVKISGGNYEITQEISQYLQEHGIKKFMWKSRVKQTDIANDLVATFPNVAHANVKISGNTLLIKIATATNNSKQSKINFYAQYDAVIKEVIAYSGLAMVSAGDVVRKGDLLVSDAYQDSVAVIGEVAFENGENITRLDISII